MNILEWLGGNDTGMSSMTLALTALGQMPARVSYPHDGDDFGRCYRLLRDCPDAAKGLEILGRDGGPVWGAMVPRWKEVEAAYLHDKELYEREGRNAKGWKCYDLMRSITDPATGRAARTSTPK